MPDNNKSITINGIVEDKRISTQDLLQEIYKYLNLGYEEFNIMASGQHNIGGPLWTEPGKTLKFYVKNPGQRVGSMGMSGTQIIIDGPAPADVGWLNSGAEIIVKGDGGDTTAHCAASGKIYVGGRTGTRSGALMKHDPKFSAPEFWILKNTGSFSFEFMGGGTAVVCGYDCNGLDSIIGHRSCIGMVGGTVYIRGQVSDLSNDVWLMELDDNDIEFLSKNMPIFLDKIEKPELLSELTNFSQWRKIVAKTFEERNIQVPLMPLKEFRLNKWVQGGIFGDLIKEDYRVSDFVEKDDLRIRIPEWRNSAYSAPCEFNCPVYIPTQKRIALLREGKLAEALKLVLDYSPFPASVCGQVCPNLCVDDCNRKFVDLPVKTNELGLLSKDINIEFPQNEKDQSIAVIGAGVAGLTAAWHLRKSGYKVDIYEQDESIGGKLKQVIPEERLSREILETEIERIKKSGINFKTGVRINKELFSELEQKYDAIAVTVGAHIPVILPVAGNEKFIKGLDFLKMINKGQKPQIGKKVVILGAGNAAMDIVIGAYNLGAKEVTAIDIQKPAAFDKEIEHAQNLGAKILWPCYTERISDEGVHLKDGSILEADTVIASIGDRPDLSFLNSDYLDEKGRIKLNDYMQTEINPKLFVSGDAIKLGLFTHAIGDGRKIAVNIDKMLSGQPLEKFDKAPVLPQDKVKSEFYYPLNPQRVGEMEAGDEADRCMSCGYCRDCEFCKDVCPEQAISRISNTDGTFEYQSDSKRCIGCGICAGICPCGVWTMQDNLDKFSEE